MELSDRAKPPAKSKFRAFGVSASERKMLCHAIENGDAVDGFGLPAGFSN